MSDDQQGTGQERQQAAELLQSLGSAWRAVGSAIVELTQVVQRLATGPALRSVLEAFTEAADQAESGPEDPVSTDRLREQLGDVENAAPVHFDSEGGFHSGPSEN